jgi:hypothetical protein
MIYISTDTPVRITDECGDGTLMCPICGGGNLHIAKVHEVVGGGAEIAFDCENCSMHELALSRTVGSIGIRHHKGSTYLSWALNPSYMNVERVAAHDKLLEEYYAARSNLYKSMDPPERPEPTLAELTRAWDK